MPANARHFDSNPTPADIAEALKRPSDFGYSGDLPIFDTWSLGPTILTRDSDTLDKSNAAAIVRTFRETFGPEGEESGWEIVRCGHWAVGWVEHLAFVVVTPDGEPSDQLRCMMDLTAALESYPVLDDSDYSEREYNGQIEAIEGEARKWIALNPPDGWASYVWHAGQDIYEDHGNEHRRAWAHFYENGDSYGPPDGRAMAEACARACVAWVADAPAGEVRDPGAFLDREEYESAGLRPMADGSIVDDDTEGED